MEYYIREDNGLDFSKYLSKCFLWMFFGLLATFATSALFCYTGLFYEIISRMGIGFVVVCSVIEIVLVIILSRSVSQLNAEKARALFFVYSIINGITLSSIFYVYDLTSIIYIFLAAAAVFGIMAFIGYTTNIDLSKLGYFIPMALITMLIMGIILMFAFNSVLYLIYSLVGVGLFMGITAYDMHMIKRMYNESYSSEAKEALAICGALELYLDFINIFLHLLSLFARSKD